MTLEIARFIPYSRADIIQLLLNEAVLNNNDNNTFKQVCDLLSHIYHFEFHQSLETLKACYAPVNPDADTNQVFNVDSDALQKKERQLFEALNILLDKANYERITEEDVLLAMTEESLFNIKLHVDFNDFEQVLFFRRGESIRQETLVSLFGLRKKEISFINYDRVVVIIKFKPHNYFNQNQRKQLYFEPGSIIVKLFQNIPRNDLEMLFPNTEVGMKLIDKMMIGIPATIGGIIMLATKLGATLLLCGSLIAFWIGMRDEPVHLNQTNLLALAIGFGTLGGFLLKQYSNFKNRKIRFMKTLTDNLYFKNLDNNMGVFHRLIDAAEEEECKEAILAYYFLIIAGKPLTAQALDLEIESWFERKQQKILDFEIDDAIQKLIKFGLVKLLSEECYEAIPLSNARQVLDGVWNNYFTYQ
ncbi:MAG TPA: TMEM143 family protein [Methylophilaceae bacterium]|nr:TMEM143 family protein [Methylophilaceae bacterium]